VLNSSTRRTRVMAARVRRSVRPHSGDSDAELGFLNAAEDRAAVPLGKVRF
jgi:hypothetical protein